MAKYDLLNQYFQSQSGNLLRMSFDQVEREAGFTLPASARRHQAWWANDRARHVQAKAWLNAGYETEQVDMKAHALVFKRVKSGVRTSRLGMAEDAGPYRHAEAVAKKPRRSPLFGALKGTFWVDPDWDLTKPAMSEEELAEMFANIERTADLIEAGLRKKPT